MKKLLILILVAVPIALFILTRCEMHSKSDVLEALDNSSNGYNQFVSLGHPYSYLIDSRLNVFRNDNGDKWAIAMKKLGYNPRGGVIDLEIHYYGNCLQNLEIENERTSNYFIVYPVDFDQFIETVDGEALKKGARNWLVRGKNVAISHNKENYSRAGIDLKEYESGEIGVEEAARLIVSKQASLFRATDDELYKSIPKDLKKILVLDEWYHKDFYMQKHEPLADKELRQAYELNKQYSPALKDMSYADFVASIRKQELLNEQSDMEQWENNRPSTYETWQQIAKVIETGDVIHYKPSMESNNHWRNFPESGSL